MGTDRLFRVAPPCAGGRGRAHYSGAARYASLGAAP